MSQIFGEEDFEGRSATEILERVYQLYPCEEIKLSTSFGAEGMVLIHLLSSMVEKPRIFTIDTCRNFPEVYELWQETTDRYGVEIESYFPNQEALNELQKKGPNAIYQSVEDRKACCQVRKVEPLNRALEDAKVWITGLRRQQSSSRAETPIVSFDEKHDVWKLCPLANWSEHDVWEFIRNNHVPYCKLHDQGYPTFGCQPCSRPMPPASDLRAGRWWWEEGDKKECGLHFEEGVLKRAATSTWKI